MSISAKVIADNKNEFGNRITTMIVTFPRIILAEFNTHRMFSRNSASSRVIPFEKMLKSVEENPFVPIAWQKDHKGMQGTEYLLEGQDGHEGDFATLNWIRASYDAIKQAKELSERGVTKQLCNRLLEPFMYHTVIVTATEWENFFSLRCPQYLNELGGIWRSKKDYLSTNKEPKDWLTCNKGQAEIHMMALAEAMWDIYNESQPKQLKAGEWHIPFGDNINLPPTIPIDKGFTLTEGVNIRKVKIATARCARVSYTIVGEEDKSPNYENDIKLHDRLLESGHMSPFEHCAKTMTLKETLGYVHSTVSQEYPEKIGKFETGRSGNFKGFIQYRKMIEDKNM